MLRTTNCQVPEPRAKLLKPTDVTRTGNTKIVLVVNIPRSQDCPKVFYLKCGMLEVGRWLTTDSLVFSG